MEQISKTKAELIREIEVLQNKLAEAEGTLDYTFENSGTAMIVFEEDATISRVNSNFEHMTGYSRFDVEGKKKWTDFVLASELEQLREDFQMRRARDEHVPRNYEVSFYHRDNTLRKVYCMVSPIPNTQKNIVISVDITDLKKTENALKQSQQQLSIIFKETPAAIVIMLPNSEELLEVNESFERIFGYSRPEVIGNKLNIFANPVDQRRMIQRIVEEGAARNFELNLRKKSGGLIVGLVSAVSIDFSGKQAFLISIYDITERKFAEEALRENQIFVQRVIDMAPNPIYIFDIAEKRNVFSNRSAKTILGYHADPVRETDSSWFDKRLHPDDYSIVTEHYQRFDTANTKDIFEIEYRVQHSCGEWRWLRSRDTLFLKNLDGTAKQILGVAEDITELKKNEEQLRLQADILEQRVHERTIELKVANEELESFSYSVSHDLRAPLRSIDGFSLALLEDYYEILDEQGRNYLNRVRASSQYMAQLIDDLLQLARVTRSDMQREKVDMSRLAATIANDLSKQDICRCIIWNIQPNLIVIGDERLLRVALENLLNNAYKFTGKHSQPNIEFGMIENEEKAVFFVKDNGAGFNMNYADRLFIPFQRLHTANEFPGTGVGLATVQRIVQRHGGRVWAEAAVGQGATFYFTLSGSQGN